MVRQCYRQRRDSPGAGKNPSGDHGGELSMCQLCGLAVLSTGRAIGDKDIG